jgi:predicted RecB family nuclease
VKYERCQLVFSPSDLIRFLVSPFASWMDRYYLEHPDAIAPDQEAEDQKLIAQAGTNMKQTRWPSFRASVPNLVEIGGIGFEEAQRQTLIAVNDRATFIYQAALRDSRFRGFADFLILDEHGRYQVWDAKLARYPKPYFPVQLCCYSEMFAATAQQPLPGTIGVILGTGERITLNVEEFIYYDRRVRADFLDLQDSFSHRLENRPLT